ncbi:outer dense fiber protein 4 isoform X2 [Tupaia chinensis]|uniref:outer dense fiber protein 4 isoform X2 n=1 Tax=Tupaia chinensis TaxID=246437 RepID=UPI0003C8F595|nr:outer dense fiber protein 4 isoform X2 [Tupaia chinensis]
MGTRSSKSESCGSGERDQDQRPGREEEIWELESTGDEPEDRVKTSIPSYRSGRRLPGNHRRDSLLPFQWRIKHSSRWLAQVLASELSLVAFILLLVMVFSKKWLHLSGSRFYQRWPANVSNRIYTTAHAMSMGLLYIYKPSSCYESENGKVIIMLSTLLLFPINLWLFELKRNVSIPIGWSYFIGWLVFTLDVTCAILCYINHKSFWSLILSCSPGTIFCGNSSELVQEPLSKKTISATSICQEKDWDPEQKEDREPDSVESSQPHTIRKK